MSKTLKVIVIVIILAAAGYLIYNQTRDNAPSDDDLEAMKESIIADPVVNVTDLTEEQKIAALERFQSAKKIVVDSNFDTLQGINDVAQIKRFLGDFEGARVAWEYANIIRPQNSLSFSNVAALYHFDLKEYDKAEENYLISIANDPDDLPTARNLFELYFYALKDNEKAEGVLLKSIEDNPEEADLYSLTARFYDDTGNTQKAIEYYEKHLAINPDNEAVKMEVDRLRSSANW